MSRKVTFVIVVLVLFHFGCRTSNGDTNAEKNVLIEIIPSIVDSICQDPRIFLSPPPMLGEFKETADGHTIIDTSLATVEQKIRYRLWQKKLDSLKMDTSKIFLAMNPKVYYSEDSLDVEFKKYFKGRKISQTKDIDSSYTMDISSIKLNRNFKFKTSSEFSRKLDVWNRKYDFVFSGFFKVSRILFDESKNYGILSASYTCGGLCGEGYIIFMKKIGSKWVIDKIIGTWIA